MGDDGRGGMRVFDDLKVSGETGEREDVLWILRNESAMTYMCFCRRYSARR